MEEKALYSLKKLTKKAFFREVSEERHKTHNKRFKKSLNNHLSETDYK